MKKDAQKQKDYKTNDNLVIGRNAVTELLKSDREVENVLVAKGEREGSINRILALCNDCLLYTSPSPRDRG